MENDEQRVYIQVCEKCYQHQKIDPHSEIDYYESYEELKKQLIGTGLKIIKNIPYKYLTQLSISQKKYLDITYHKVRNFPQSGAFEVYFLKILVYSKLQTGIFPNISALAAIILKLQQYYTYDPQMIAIREFRNIELEWNSALNPKLSLMQYLMIMNMDQATIDNYLACLQELIKQKPLEALKNLSIKPYSIYFKKEKLSKIQSIYCQNTINSNRKKFTPRSNRSKNFKNYSKDQILRTRKDNNSNKNIFNMIKANSSQTNEKINFQVTNKAQCFDKHSIKNNKIYLGSSFNQQNQYNLRQLVLKRKKKTKELKASLVKCANKRDKIQQINVEDQFQYKQKNKVSDEQKKQLQKKKNIQSEDKMSEKNEHDIKIQFEEKISKVEIDLKYFESICQGDGKQNLVRINAFSESNEQQVNEIAQNSTFYIQDLQPNQTARDSIAFDKIQQNKIQYKQSEEKKKQIDSKLLQLQEYQQKEGYQGQSQFKEEFKQQQFEKNQLNYQQCSITKKEGCNLGVQTDFKQKKEEQKLNQEQIWQFNQINRLQINYEQAQVIQSFSEHNNFKTNWFREHFKDEKCSEAQFNIQGKQLHQLFQIKSLRRMVKLTEIKLFPNNLQKNDKYNSPLIKVTNLLINLNPLLLINIFQNKKHVNPDGIYCVWLSTMNGVYQPIMVTDQFAFNSTRQPIYAPLCGERSVYLMILEKAVAKVLGGYHKINQVSTSTLFRIITGGPASQIGSFNSSKLYNLLINQLKVIKNCLNVLISSSNRCDIKRIKTIRQNNNQPLKSLIEFDESACQLIQFQKMRQKYPYLSIAFFSISYHLNQTIFQIKKQKINKISFIIQNNHRSDINCFLCLYNFSRFFPTKVSIFESVQQIKIQNKNQQFCYTSSKFQYVGQITKKGDYFLQNDIKQGLHIIVIQSIFEKSKKYNVSLYTSKIAKIKGFKQISSQVNTSIISLKKKNIKQLQKINLNNFTSQQQKIMKKRDKNFRQEQNNFQIFRIKKKFIEDDLLF